MMALTKKDLLAHAKQLNIKGRHEMTLEDLQFAINAEIAVQGGVTPDYSADSVKAAKRRHPSLNRRDEEGRVIRAGSNLSGNLPFARKFYYLDPAVAVEKEWTDEYRTAVEAAPAQVRLLLKFMRDHRITSVETSELGGDIAGLAIKKGVVKSKIDPAHLFAYYRRVMERLGLKHYDARDVEEGGDEE